MMSSPFTIPPPPYRDPDPVQFVGDDPEPEPDAKMWGYGGKGWYFSDETWAYMYGPFGSETEARAELVEYAKGV